MHWLQGNITLKHKNMDCLLHYWSSAQIKPRLGGEKLHLYGRVGAWPLKKAIQSAQIFPWQRHTIQILSIDNVMLGVLRLKDFGWSSRLIVKRVDGNQI